MSQTQKPAAEKLPRHLLSDDITPRNEAIYVPAVTPKFAQDVYAERWSRPLPNGVSAKDLNFLDPHNNFFRISHALTSAGQALNQKEPCIITERDRKKTILQADSGGYQIASGRLKIEGDKDRLKILRWQERVADIAMTLDVPTGPVRRTSNYFYSSVADCLAATLEHLRFYQKNRKADIVFLNVVQGNTPGECDRWYHAVKSAFTGEGYAFAGPLRHNMFELCRRLFEMLDDGQLAKINWIHALGTSQLEVGVLLTALQNTLNKHINPNLRISYDTSSPFRNLAWNNVFTIPTFSAKEMTMPTRDAPDGPEFVGSEVRWPWTSPLGNRMLMGDFCLKLKGKANTYRDTQSNHYLAHHNLSALCWAIALANRVFIAESINRQHTIAKRVGEAAEAIERIFSTQSRAELLKSAPIFARLKFGKIETNSEEERDF